MGSLVVKVSSRQTEDPDSISHMGKIMKAFSSTNSPIYKSFHDTSQTIQAMYATIVQKITHFTDLI